MFRSNRERQSVGLSNLLCCLYKAGFYTTLCTKSILKSSCSIIKDSNCVWWVFFALILRIVISLGRVTRYLFFRIKRVRVKTHRVASGTIERLRDVEVRVLVCCGESEEWRVSRDNPSRGEYVRKLGEGPGSAYQNYLTTRYLRSYPVAKENKLYS